MERFVAAATEIAQIAGRAGRHMTDGTFGTTGELNGLDAETVNAVENHQFDEAVDGYFARHRVKPGITGWAQINGWRGELTDADKIKGRVEHDLYYIENWSLLFDLEILLKTPISLLKSENAY